MRKLLTVCLSGAVVLLMATQGQAQIVNGNFESGTGSNFDGGQTITGWTLTGNTGRTTGPQNVLVGNFSAVLNFGNTAPNGTLSQTFATAIGTSYNLSFLYGVNGINRNQVLGIQLDGVGGTGSLLDTTVTVTSSAGELFAFSFVADSGTTTLRFLDTGTNNTTSSDILIDSVVVSAAPEPGTLALLALGVAGLAVRRRK